MLSNEEILLRVENLLSEERAEFSALKDTDHVKPFLNKSVEALHEISGAVAKLQKHSEEVWAKEQMEDDAE